MLKTQFSRPYKHERRVKQLCLRASHDGIWLNGGVAPLYIDLGTK